MDEVKKRHKQFAKNVVSGMSQTDAYSAVYPKASRASCGVKGSQLIKNDEVKRHISYFLNKKGLKRQDLIGKMAQIVGDVEHKDCFNAIKLGLELHGDLKGEEGGPKVNINYNVNNDQLNSAIEKITNMTNKLRDLEGYPSGQIYETEDAEIIE